MSNYLAIFNRPTTEYCKIKAKNETEALIKLKDRLGISKETSLGRFVEVFNVTTVNLDKVEQI